LVSFGTVSGGLGAKLTGGNFWAGAATGFTVSAFNHLMHKITMHKFDKEINTAYGGKADSEAPKTIETVNSVKDNVPTLKKWHSKSGNPTIDVNPNQSFASDGSSEALTFLNSDYKTSYTTYFGASFVSYRHLAHTMLHELGHAYFNYLGYRKATLRDYGDFVSNAGSERFAFQFAYKNGGISYQFHSWYIINNKRLGTVKNDSRFNY
jgi:hypothetical protein